VRDRLACCLKQAEEDQSTSVVVLRGAGRSFCVGYDIGTADPEKEAWRHDAIKWQEHLAHTLELEMTPWSMRKPVIASIQGHALGGGCELAMFCDLSVAADNAVFGEPEVRFSNSGPGMVMPWIIGLKRARELLYFGDTIDATTALDFGMVNKVVPLAELESATLAYAQRLSLISQEALTTTKLAINRGADVAGFHGAMLAGLDILAPLYAAKTETGMEFIRLKETKGLRAALEWRMAQFKI
jgi:enoyl-CoA hydratase/carnithine racemase